MNDWGFTASEDWAVKYEENLRKYNEPITSHDCDHFGCTGRYPRPLGHEFHEVYDDFEMSQRKREEFDMEVVRAKGNELKQRLIIRRFISTHDGSYIIRLQATDSAKLQRERMGDLRFETEEDCNEYFNYCIDLFEFSKSLRIEDEPTGWDFGDDDDDSDGWDFEDDDEDDDDSWSF